MMRDRRLLDRLSPEARLLLLAAGPPSVDGEIAALVATGALDWGRLLTVADRERATAIVWRRVQAHVPPSMPGEVRSSFERMAMIGSFSAGYLEQRIGETVAHMNERGIPALLLKGAALAATVYPSFADRPMGDIDIVVPAGQGDAAFAAFQEIGWRWDATGYSLDRYGKHHHYPPLFDSRGMDVRLELHRELLVEGNPFALPASELFAEGQSVKIGPGTAIVPPPEILLLHTCIHYTWSHMMLFGAWRAFRDVIALTNAGVDWTRFLDRARRHKAESSCFWTLRLAERLTGAVLPPEVMERLGQSTTHRMVGICERHACREMIASPDRCPSQWLRRTLWEVAIQPDRAGHGSARPWLLDDMAPENINPSSREGGGLRAFRQLTRLGAWLRYAGAILR